MILLFLIKHCLFKDLSFSHSNAKPISHHLTTLHSSALYSKDCLLHVSVTKSYHSTVLFLQASTAFKTSCISIINLQCIGEERDLRHFLLFSMLISEFDYSTTQRKYCSQIHVYKTVTLSTVGVLHTATDLKCPSQYFY